MNWLLLIVAAAAVNLILAEAFDWLPWFARRIVKRAARCLPTPTKRDRYEAEWLAELDALPSRRFATLIFALTVLASVPRLRVALSQKGSLRQRLLTRTCDLSIHRRSAYHARPSLSPHRLERSAYKSGASVLPVCST
jgi:hypothetical protein